MVKKISRKDAARCLARVASVAARATDEATDDAGAEALRDALLAVLAAYGIQPPTRCTGEAHSNPYIDHCPVCMPGWGWIEDEIKVG